MLSDINNTPNILPINSNTNSNMLFSESNMFSTDLNTNNPNMMIDDPNIFRTNFNKPIDYDYDYDIKKTQNTLTKTIYSIFHSIVAFFAIFLSFKCNRGFSFVSFLIAIFFPHIYIIYIYATTGSFCNTNENY